VTNLQRPSVSLTKHGAHKLAKLLEQLPPDMVIQNTWGQISGVNIDAAQARKILSAKADSQVPPVWLAAKTHSPFAIKSLVLLAIVFSHHATIDALKRGVSGPGRGTIRKTYLPPVKAFTNLKDNFRELGFITSESATGFSYDLRSALRSVEIGRLAKAIFREKLLNAGWKGDTDPVDECIAADFHKTLGITKVHFRAWTSSSFSNLDDIEDTSDAAAASVSRFNFRAGHKKRRAGEVARRGHGEDAIARLIHNDLQNSIYERLAAAFGRKNVGSEVRVGDDRTSIDLIVRLPVGLIFYEIKTSRSLRKCLREGVPQLLEYAFWPKDDRAIKLVIVSMNKPTEDAKAYLNHLRDKFGLALFHQTANRKTGVLSDEI
jgi:hypothetical protein